MLEHSGCFVVYYSYFISILTVLCIFCRLKVATVINGRAMAKQVKDELRAEVLQWVSEGHKPPCLTAILVGTVAASDTYVRNKMKAADYIGLFSFVFLLVSLLFQCIDNVN